MNYLCITMDRRYFLKTSALGLLFAGVPGRAALRSGAAESPAPAAVRVRESFDILIKGGTIYDGSGNPGIRGDLGIRDGRIEATGRNLGRSAGMLVDAGGLAVAPGFIDIHSHTDTNLFRAPKGDSRIFQGVTTELGGNCGSAPFVRSDAAWEKRRGTTMYGQPAWRDADGFLAALEASGIGINYATLTGHGNLRNAVVGNRNVRATDDQIRRMCEILDRELELGSIGLSFGLEYAPGCYCDTREMVELCKVVARHDALYTIHMRNEDDHVLEAIDEAIEAARQSGARLEISHLKAQNPANFDKLPRMLAKIDAARAEGIDIAFDRYPYTAFSTGMTNLIPIEYRDGGAAAILSRLDDPSASRAIGDYAVRRMQRYGGADKVLVAACSREENKAYSGRNIAECCALSGMDEWEMVRHLLKTERLGVNMAVFAMKEENLRTLYAHPLSMPGSDGAVYSPEKSNGKSLPHPRAYGTFARFFEKFVREDRVLDLPTAVRKCTSLPASRMRLKERGLLLPGYAADVTVFDPSKIADIATYAQPHTLATGICDVIVNGRAAILDGKHTGTLAGRCLRLE